MFPPCSELAGFSRIRSNTKCRLRARVYQFRGKPTGKTELDVRHVQTGLYSELNLQQNRKNSPCFDMMLREMLLSTLRVSSTHSSQPSTQLSQKRDRVDKQSCVSDLQIFNCKGLVETPKKPSFSQFSFQSISPRSAGLSPERGESGWVLVSIGHKGPSKGDSGESWVVNPNHNPMRLNDLSRFRRVYLFEIRFTRNSDGRE